jgi:hypothetical protein
MRARNLVALFVLPPLLCLAAGFAAYQRVAYDDFLPRLDDDARAAAMGVLRGVVDGKPAARPVHAELDRRQGAFPVVVSLWSLGVRVERLEAQAPLLADAFAQAATALAASPALARLDTAARREARISVDVVIGEAPLWPLFTVTSALGVIPGLDGLGVSHGDRRYHLMPDELVELQLLGSLRLLPQVPEFRIGLDLEHADAILGGRAQLPAGSWGAKPRAHFRLRTDSFVEGPENARGVPLPLFRGRPPAPPLTAANLRAGALLGGDYLVAHLHENGRYYYEVNLTTGQTSNPTELGGSYSLPRHAGTSYFLSQLYADTKTPELGSALVRAFDHMVFLIGQGGCEGQTKAGKPFQCVVDKGQRQASLGSTALAVVAVAEYRLASGDPRYDAMLRAMAEWIVSLSKPNGRFAHLYDVPTHTPDMKTEMLYYDGEAALAMIRAYRVFGDPRYLVAAERALDALVGQYDFFAGRFFVGEEHWTCIAAEAGWPELKHDRYREFCSDYAAFLRVQQFDADEIAGQPDLAGSYSVTPFFVPHNTPAGSRSEAMISAYMLGVHHGRPDERIKRQVLSAMSYSADSDWFTPAAHAYGAVPTSTIERNVRIDYVQHTCSAMLRAIPLMGGGQTAKPN